MTGVLSISPNFKNTILTSSKRDIEQEIRASSDSVETDMALFKDGQAALAEVLLTSARQVDGNGAGYLQPVAVALELLELGVKKQFGPGRPAGKYGSAGANLALITADRYYARALELVVSLGDDRYVACLCDALALVSEACAYPEAPGAGAKREAFRRAAETLGRLTGEK